MFLLGVFAGLSVAAIAWVSWYLAPLGDPETGAGRHGFREGATRSNIKSYSHVPPERPPAPPRPKAKR
jgi:hypothetical protein